MIPGYILPNSFFNCSQCPFYLYKWLETLLFCDHSNLTSHLSSFYLASSWHLGQFKEGTVLLPILMLNTSCLLPLHPTFFLPHFLYLLPSLLRDYCQPSHQPDTTASSLWIPTSCNLGLREFQLGYILPAKLSTQGLLLSLILYPEFFTYYIERILRNI